MFTFASILSLLLLGASARRLIPSASSSITLPLHLLPRDSTTNSNTSLTVAGITPVSLSSDRQTYYVVLQTGDVYFRVALDSASSDLWIVGSSCTTPTCKAVPSYPLSYASPTFGVVNNNQTLFKASYADGTVASGFVARESVQLANLTLPQQVFAVVTESNVTLLDDVSGIMGLGFPRLSTIPSSVTNSTPFFPALAQQGILDYPLFGLSLTHDGNGSLSFGAVDSTVVKNVSKIGWNQVVEFSPVGAESNASSYLHWVTPLAAFSVNGTKISPVPTYANVTGNSSLALFDIGTSGMFGPYQDVERLFAQIDGARLVDDGLWAVPCDTAVPISFTFGQQTYTLDPTDYLIGPASGEPEICLTWPRALPPSSDGIDWQFGGAFLRTVYSIFSYGINLKEAPRIGFYPLNNATETAEAPVPTSYFATMSETVTTDLPNSLLSTPSFSTPTYAFNTSIQASTGGILTSALATSTYSALLGPKATRVTSLPLISPEPTVTTITSTNSQGSITITTSTLIAAVTLGVPPGGNAASSLSAFSVIPLMLCFVSLVVNCVL
ncbi:Aspartic protease [Mycena sanguinolenta]|uniref:Aspartic protease n=1 Tax=Mycena sanguinolenta TaxID=230812 RepID=A0A8H6ZCR3_9AGAR|nr:Aspartic protease [Mycena sanguinolenta]